MPSFAGITFEIVGTAHPISHEVLARCEQHIGSRFPECYREFITHVGPGYFEEIPIRVFDPERICESTCEDRERLKQYWFWHESSSVLSQERGILSVECFDTDIGHDLRFVPPDASLFYFMSHDDEAIVACRDLADVLPLVGVPFSRESVFTFHPFQK